MDQSAAPWRAIEDPQAATASGIAPTPPTRAAGPLAAVGPLTVGLAAAAVLIGV